MGEPLGHSAGALAAVFASLIELSPEETSALRLLDERMRSLRRGSVLQRQNDPSNEVYVVRHGQMMSFRLLDDGRRQILRFVFPGEIVGAGGLFSRRASEGLSALTDTAISVVDRASLGRLLLACPRLAVVVAALGGLEAAVLSDRLALLGRSSARARTCALLLELRDRMHAATPAAADSFVVGLTQEEIGDAIGLTAVHVNRMLRQLAQERLIARDGARVTLLDEAAMRQVSGYIDRVRQLDLGWLAAPPAR